MLVITRRPGESFTISPAVGVDPDMKVSELFVAGPIKVTITGTLGGHVGIGIDAPKPLAVLREELIGRDAGAGDPQRKLPAGQLRLLKSSSLLRRLLPRALMG
ncbi:MAG: carbon storage regulator [Chromatiales bacterium]